MKILYSLVLSIALFNSSHARTGAQQEIPKKISDALEVKYPSSENKKWGFANNTYSVKFIKDKKKSTATFDTNGTWQSTLTIISSSGHLPTTVKDAFFKSQFSAWYIESIEKNEAPDTTFYKFIINNGNLLDGDHHDAFLKKYLVEFSKEGILLTQTKL